MVDGYIIQGVRDMKSTSKADSYESFPEEGWIALDALL